jgi:hypothetical protein
MMEKKEFDVMIDASPEKIWDVLWNENTYNKWTSEFSEGSYAETDWKEGSKILFLDGKGQGMVSRVEEHRPNEYMSIKHVGMVKDGQEIMDGPEVEEWKGVLENYTLIPEGGKTRLMVDVEVMDEWKEYFDNTWPKALNKVKELAEGRS